MSWLINQGVAVFFAIVLFWAYREQVALVADVVRNNTIAISEVAQSLRDIDRRLSAIEQRGRDR
ncbi:MAG: hypothetical protein ACRDGM_18045 [bacterium]